MGEGLPVALILAEHGADPMTVITAVLHDLEDVGAQDVAMEFTSDTALRATFGDAIVDLLCEFTAFDRSGPIPPPETTDRRVLAINVADRLHNMRAISCLHPEVQGQITGLRRPHHPAARGGRGYLP